MGVLPLRRVQYGLEAVNGTAVAADTLLFMEASLPSADREIHVPDVDTGVRSSMLLDAAVVRRLNAVGLTIADGDGAYFEMMPLLLSCCLNGNVTPVEQTTGQGDYLWTFTAPQTGAEDLDTMTLEVGADDPGAATAGYEISYVLVESITISGDCVSGEVHVTANCAGDLVDQTTVTGSLSLTNIQMCQGKLSRIWIDDTWSALGTNELASALLNWSITINGGGHHKWWGSASMLPSGHNQGYITGEATFTFERDSGPYTEEANFRPATGYAQTPRFIELVLTGPQIAAGEDHSWVFDMAGVWTDWQTYGAEEAGNSLDVVTLTMGYDITGTQMFQALVTTDIAAI